MTRCDRSHTDMSESSQISLPAAHRATQLRRNIGILTEKLDSARIFFAQIQLLAETHPARYRTARTDKNSSFPLFDLGQVLHTNRSSLRRRGCQRQSPAGLRGRVSDLPGNPPGWPKIGRVENRRILLRILRIRLAENRSG